MFNAYNIMLLVGTTLTSSLGAIFLKKGMNKVAKLNFLNIVKSIWIWIGFLTYGLSLILNVFLLANMEYSIAFPMTAFTYVWTIVFSYLLFKEKITFKKILSITLIIIGIFILAK